MFLTSFHLIQSEGGLNIWSGFCYFFAFLTAAFTKSGLTGGDDQISTNSWELVKDVYLAHFHQSKRFISD